jgi:hypothetical protein
MGPVKSVILADGGARLSFRLGSLRIKDDAHYLRKRISKSEQDRVHAQRQGSISTPGFNMPGEPSAPFAARSAVANNSGLDSTASVESSRQEPPSRHPEVRARLVR